MDRQIFKQLQRFTIEWCKVSITRGLNTKKDASDKHEWRGIGIFSASEQVFMETVQTREKEMQLNNDILDKLFLDMIVPCFVCQTRDRANSLLLKTQRRIRESRI
jgi:hypothetical protein